MRKRPTTLLLSAVSLWLALGVAPPSLAGFDEKDAKRACRKRLAAEGYDSVHEMEVRKKGHAGYKVTGRIKIKHGKDKAFHCRTERRRVGDIEYKGDFGATKAARLCREALLRRYGYRHVRKVSTQNQGKKYFKIKGRVRNTAGKDDHFTCRVDDGRVISIEVTPRG